MAGRGIVGVTVLWSCWLHKTTHSLSGPAPPTDTCGKYLPVDHQELFQGRQRASDLVKWGIWCITGLRSRGVAPYQAALSQKQRGRPAFSHLQAHPQLTTQHRTDRGHDRTQAGRLLTGQPQWKRAHARLRLHTAQPQFGRKTILETSEKKPHLTDSWWCHPRCSLGPF